jgi:hypothetical protein
MFGSIWPETLSDPNHPILTSSVMNANASEFTLPAYAYSSEAHDDAHEDYTSAPVDEDEDSSEQKHQREEEFDVPATWAASAIAVGAGPSSCAVACDPGREQVWLGAADGRLLAYEHRPDDTMLELAVAVAAGPRHVPVMPVVPDFNGVASCAGGALRYHSSGGFPRLTFQYVVTSL